MKYQSINIRIKLFKNGSVVIHYSNKTEIPIPIDDIIGKLEKEISFNTKLTNCKLARKVVQWKTSGNDLEKIKSYMQQNYKGNYDIIEHKSSSLPWISFAIHGNKIRLGRKSISCINNKSENKEIDNFMSILQKYFTVQNNEVQNEDEDDDINNEVNDIIDNDLQLTIII